MTDINSVLIYGVTYIPLPSLLASNAVTINETINWHYPLISRDIWRFCKKMHFCKRCIWRMIYVMQITLFREFGKFHRRDGWCVDNLAPAMLQFRCTSLLLRSLECTKYLNFQWASSENYLWPHRWTLKRVWWLDAICMVRSGNDLETQGKSTCSSPTTHPSSPPLSSHPPRLGHLTHPTNQCPMIRNPGNPLLWTLHNLFTKNGIRDASSTADRNVPYNAETWPRWCPRWCTRQ